MIRLTLLLCLGLAVAARGQSVPDDFDATLSSLAALVEQEEMGALDLAKGSYDASRLFAVGAAGLSRAEPRFRSALTLGEASVAGLYMTVWGKQPQIDAVRRELEANPAKRRWLQALVGSEERFAASMATGQQYQPLLRLMPDVGGTRILAMQCLRSRDTLVRRAGMLWGYWLADGAYWSALKGISDIEQDVSTKRLALRLLQKRPASP